MKTSFPLRCASVLFAAVLLTLTTGCLAPRPQSLSGYENAALPDLRSYRTATVLPFEPLEGSGATPTEGDLLATDVAARLRREYGDLFQEVQFGPAPSRPDQLIVTGNISKYAPGSRLGRFFLIGVTPASLEGEVVFQDGPSGATLFRAPFDKLWAWGGMLGASKGITELLNETAANAARTVAEAKGWQASK